MTTYGIYNAEDEEWTGWFTNDEAQAQKVADALTDDPIYGVAFVEDGQMLWLCESSEVIP